jgi:PKD repeat protein
MNKLYKITILLIGIYFTFLGQSNIVYASIGLPWSTTFDLPDFTGGYGSASPGGGLVFLANTGHPVTKITSSANYSGGNGGKGLRVYIYDGDNINSDAPSIEFSAPQKELWIRFYVRYPAGFNWSSLSDNKWVYLYTGNYLTSAVCSWANGNYVRIWQVQATSPYTADPTASGYGWGYVNDGNWHCYEFHLKMDTKSVNGVYDGIGEIWVEGTKVGRDTSVNYSNGDNSRRNGWTMLQINCNQKTAANAGGIGNPAYVDYDDFAVSNTGYIGPIGTSGTLPITNPPAATFIATPTTGSSPLAVTFTNTEIVNIPTSWAWDFNNDGVVDSTSQTPTYTYSTAGTYSVKLTVANGAGSNSLTKTNFITVTAATVVPTSTPTALFTENFDDVNFSSRSWYDNLNINISTSQHALGSSSSAEFHFLQGATQPTSGSAIRKKITETDSIYVSYYVKYSSNWTGSNKTYQPHQFMLLTNKNGDWDAPAYTHLTTYIEENEGIPLIAIQDGQNINESMTGQDLTNTTENRSVAGCNGSSDSYSNGSCYLVDSSTHWNWKEWRATGTYFSDSAGSYYKGDWHHVEAYIKLNSISSGKAVKDGVIQYWYDGTLVMNFSNVIMRTGANADMKYNQFVIAPWIGDGSPVDQTFWIDNLSVVTARPTTTTDTTPPSKPVGITVKTIN